MEVLTAVLAFAGAALGSAVGYRATAGATKVEREARRREEWGRRFTAALTAVTSSEPRQVDTGQALLVQLVQSDLATDEDRQEARAVLEVIATHRSGVDLHLVLPAEALSSAVLVEDTGDQDTREGEDG
jgi:hypothetical protein